MFHVLVIGDNKGYLYNTIRLDEDANMSDNDISILSVYNATFYFIPDFMCYRILHNCKYPIDILLCIPGSDPHKDDIIRRHICSLKNIKFTIVANLPTSKEYYFYPAKSYLINLFAKTNIEMAERVIDLIYKIDF